MILRDGTEKTFDNLECVYLEEQENGYQIIYTDYYIKPIYDGEKTVGVILKMED